MNAIITGASKGIGKAIAIKLALAGYDLAVCSRNQTDLNNLKKQINLINPSVKIVALQTDCANRAQLKQFAGFVQQHYPVVDVLINNAGTYIPSAILDEQDETLPIQMDLNVYAAHYLCKVFGRTMRNVHKGHIINICSVAAIKPVIAAGSYSVTKFALLGLTRVLRQELMPYNVKVTAIIPGSTLTESWAGNHADPDKFVTAEDVASAVLSCLNLSAGANIDELIIRPLKGEVN